MNESNSSQDTSDQLDILVQLARQAVREAQQRSRELGVANVYSINGKLLYELPNGELSLTKPKRSPRTDR
jgi:hypothetical protein